MTQINEAETPVVIHERAKQRFRISINGLHCLLQYSEERDGTLDYHRTYTPPELRGNNLAAMLVFHALEHAKAERRKVIPSCSYVADYLDKHPKYKVLATQKKPQSEKRVYRSLAEY